MPSHYTGEVYPSTDFLGGRRHRSHHRSRSRRHRGGASMPSLRRNYNVSIPMFHGSRSHHRGRARSYSSTLHYAGAYGARRHKRRSHRRSRGGSYYGGKHRGKGWWDSIKSGLSSVARAVGPGLLNVGKDLLVSVAKKKLGLGRRARSHHLMGVRSHRSSRSRTHYGSRRRSHRSRTHRRSGRRSYHGSRKRYSRRRSYRGTRRHSRRRHSRRTHRGSRKRHSRRRSYSRYAHGSLYGGRRRRRKHSRKHRGKGPLGSLAAGLLGHLLPF